MTRRVPHWVGDRDRRGAPSSPEPSAASAGKSSGQPAATFTGRSAEKPARSVGGRPGDDRPRDDRPEDDWPDTGSIGGSTRTQATLSRALTYGLWGAIALTLVLGLVNCAGNPAAPDPRGAAEPEPVPPPGGCAELTVAAWLAGDTDLLAGVPGLGRPDPELGRRQADRTYAVSVSPGTDPDSWVYLVGAEVREYDLEEERWQAAGSQFFTVTLGPAEEACDGWAPTALPARVPPPVLGGADPAYSVRLAHAGSPLAETLTAFFTALLTGDGSVERFVAPDTVVTPFDPAPYTEIMLLEVRAHRDTPLDRSSRVPADGTAARLLVTVATDPQGVDLPLAYPVVMGVRGGRWEVVEIDPAHEGTDPAPASRPTP